MLTLSRLPLSKQHITAPITLLVLVVLAFLFDEQLAHQLEYQRNGILTGELWRLITGHLLHTNLNHLMLNSAAIVLLWALHGQFYTTSEYLLIFLLSAIGTCVGLLVFSPELISYVGLSGCLHSLFVYGALKDLNNQDKTGYLLLLGVTIKLVHEQMLGADPAIAQLIDANVAIDAHLFGAIIGLIIFCILEYNHKKLKSL